MGEPEEEYEPEPTICCICGEPIEGDDMEGRYWLHEIGCDFYESGSCDCDLECHADCYKGHESEYLQFGAARRIFDVTGLDAYGPGWTKKRVEVAKWASNDRATDYMELTVAELNRANVQLAKAKGKAYNQTVAA